MYKLSEKMLEDYPLVRLFFDSPPPGSSKRGVHQTHLIASNGINMLCCESDGQAYVVPLRCVVKVSPRSSDRLYCHLDSVTGCLLVQDRRTDKIRSLGPIRGRPEPNIDLSAVASQFNLVLTELPAAGDVITFNTAHKSPITSAKEAELAVEHTYDELIGRDSTRGIISLDELEPPDLTDFEL